MLVGTVTVVATLVASSVGPSIGTAVASTAVASTAVASTAVASTAVAGPGAASSPPPPPADAGFHIQFTGALRVPAGVGVVEVDGDVPRRQIAALQRTGRYVICYVSAGSVEDWRTDADEVPREAIGKPLAGWPGERWLDVRHPGVLRVVTARVARLADKGCQGVEFDNVDGYANDTGFPLTARDQLRYNISLARVARAAGLSPGLKNAVGLIPRLVSQFDWALNEECVTYRECDRYRPFTRAGKPVFVLEYGEVGLTRVCSVTERYGLLAQVKRLRLDAWAARC